MPMNDLPVHDIGLVMAGAVSAGAYSAGVIDFFVEAMDALAQAQQRDDPRAPSHRVRLGAITGASGGAMTAGILAAILAGRAHRPVREPDPGTSLDDNALFESWVNRIDAEVLLDTGDLQREEGRLWSILNGDVLHSIAKAAVPDGAGRAPKPWLAPDLRLAMTLTNLRGVPYNLGVGGVDDQPRPGYGMRRHADALAFALGSENDAPGRVGLDWAMRGEGWARLRLAALASGAFPLVLPPLQVQRPGSDYRARLWPFAGVPDDPGRYRPLPPHWGDAGEPERYSFLAVDGGMIDNKPVALGRELLVGVPPRLPESPVAGRTLIAVDPFPDVADFRGDEAPPEGLLDVGRALLTAMKNQTRFKPEELLTAVDDPHAHRQLIAPSRREHGERAAHPLAGGSLDGFGGFLDRGFRLHDFHLGRCNAQRFFREHLRLPGTHPLFAAWSAAQRQAHADSRGRLPVLPLLGTAARPLPMPAWPRLPDGRLDQLAHLLRRRSRELMPLAVDHLLARSSRPMRWVTRVLARRQSRGWVAALIDHIRRDLLRRGQL
ncbi:hypothetical protein B1808_10425 [Pseudofulvimonas gallinarii]|uniref:Patatin-like phospholipase n=2 Tax=Pseudofulvimonas gallinarii TaxID=634155 RepID=A0A4R3LF53_9GAMM|nr:patatin-like phospholipase [Pseudofulvimonas gallinarii]THD12973.1 hypothetical protein B1808_10425 [Pseudofulvimonas gallinarii]